MSSSKPDEAWSQTTLTRRNKVDEGDVDEKEQDSVSWVEEEGVG